MEEKAVALEYRKDLPAPILISKGKGELAKRIKRLAQEYGIQLVEDIELTDRLFLLETGEWIPEDLYEIIAGIYAFLYEIQNNEIQNEILHK